MTKSFQASGQEQHSQWKFENVSYVEGGYAFIRS